VTDALSGKSKCRNKAIAEAFQYMKIIEGWGTGLPRLFRRCKELALPDPKFEEFGDGIKVTIYRAIRNNETSRNKANNEAKEAKNEANRSNNEANEAKNEANRSNNEANDSKCSANRAIHVGCEESLSTRIIKIITNNPKISQQRLAIETGVARSTIQRYMGQMVKEGRIQRIGGTRGSWTVQDKD